MNFIVVYSAKHKKHHPRKEFFAGKEIEHAEKPARIENIFASLKKLKPKMIKPSKFIVDDLYETHDKSYVSFIKKTSNSVKGEIRTEKFCFDTYTPITAGTFEAALASARVAKIGAKLILSGQKLVYSLCRPPGHHASFKLMGGYCYFNNAAIAANYLSKHGKVAIFDIDYHHGNGTQDIFYERSDVLYVSIHADPKFAYPHRWGFADEQGKGKGLGFNINFPLNKNVREVTYLSMVGSALENVRKFNPEFLIVSVGFDTYYKDPVGGLSLSINSYAKISEKISNLKLPTLIVQEGGYNISDLGKIAKNFMHGFS